MLVHVQLIASLNRDLRRTRSTTSDINERLIARFIRRDPRAQWSPGPSVTLARLLALLREASRAAGGAERGASLDEIARLLRHKDHDSTAIYAKVDLGALRRLVVALPGSAS